VTALPFRDLRAYIEALRARRLLYEVRQTVNKDTELMPVVRWQYRGLPESQRRTFLFHRVTDGRGRSFDTSGVVVSAVGASRQGYAAGLGVETEGRPEAEWSAEVRDRWLRALDRPVDPVSVSPADAPCKEVIIRGDELKERGLDAFPIPISSPGWDPAPFITSGHWVTRDPDTGVRNVGNYRAMLKANDRIGIQIFPTQHEGIHWTKCRQQGKPLQAAVVIGVAPAISMAAVSKVPYGTDELAIAGALAGMPVETVRCETVDIEVPAWAEIVVEGEITTEYVEPEAPFGEFSGYMGERTVHPFMTVSCITHRRRPYFQAFISQFPPSESSKTRGIANEAVYYDVLKNRCNIPAVQNVVFHEPSGAQGIIVIQMKKTNPSQPWQALRIAASLDPTYGKVCVAVDEDVDPFDIDAVMWALASRMQPHLDVQITQGQASMLDPSSAHPDLPNEKQWYPDPRGASSMLIDATRKWHYPPVSLPLREYMERAREIWEENGLPPLQPRQPWFGYTLGPWPEEYTADARLASQGRYLEIGERMGRQRRRIDA
jgi:UbiD family decarboxylase